MFVEGNGTCGGNASGDGTAIKHCARKIRDELSGCDGIDEGRDWDIQDLQRCTVV
jgi:hypothetical protein